MSDRGGIVIQRGRCPAPPGIENLYRFVGGQSEGHSEFRGTLTNREPESSAFCYGGDVIGARYCVVGGDRGPNSCWSQSARGSTGPVGLSGGAGVNSRNDG